MYSLAARVTYNDIRVLTSLLNNTQQHTGQFTLFAPTDLAFNEFLQKLGGVKEVS